ncbi:MAG: SDR family oxidoreductase [Microbacterium sp.]|uniref:SDR family NAD(P)-dependent oxidoreductase n=1 Tax=Microbacterium sp. TaxID=51671 RepID=UPI00260276DC|nr:glucose 1-dehydrogenase [Microbacterium sp.]MCX6501508.1 SDR family oxidoreductase [Microbacterium sp.]
MLLEGKTALITGASSGIGETTAKRIATEGASVLVADVNEEGGRRVVDEITAAGGVATFLRVDVTDADQVDAMVAEVVAKWGRLDLAVNNAGLAEQPGAMHELALDAWNKTIGIDLTGTFLCMRAELRQFVSQGGGVIVNTASGAGLKATPNLTAYSAAKHGVVGLTRTAAIEYITQNIRVNAVAPGTILTPAMQNFGDEQLKEWSALMPTGRLGTTDEVAAGIVWLLSDQASYTTGTVLEIDGGYMQV